MWLSACCHVPKWKRVEGDSWRYWPVDVQVWGVINANRAGFLGIEVLHLNLKLWKIILIDRLNVSRWLWQAAKVWIILSSFIKKWTFNFILKHFKIILKLWPPCYVCFYLSMRSTPCTVELLDHLHWLTYLYILYCLSCCSLPVKPTRIHNCAL